MATKINPNKGITTNFVTVIAGALFLFLAFLYQDFFKQLLYYLVPQGLTLWWYGVLILALTIVVIFLVRWMAKPKRRR